MPPFTMDNTIDYGMRPWGHSDYEFLIQNKMSEDKNRVSQKLKRYFTNKKKEHTNTTS